MSTQSGTFSFPDLVQNTHFLLSYCEHRLSVVDTQHVQNRCSMCLNYCTLKVQFKRNTCTSVATNQPLQIKHNKKPKATKRPTKQNSLFKLQTWNLFTTDCREECFLKNKMAESTIMPILTKHMLVLSVVGNTQHSLGLSRQYYIYMSPGVASYTMWSSVFFLLHFHRNCSCLFFSFLFENIRLNYPLFTKNSTAFWIVDRSVTHRWLTTQMSKLLKKKKKKSDCFYLLYLVSEQTYRWRPNRYYLLFTTFLSTLPDITKWKTDPQPCLKPGKAFSGGEQNTINKTKILQADEKSCYKNSRQTESINAYVCTISNLMLCKLL